MPRWSMFLIFLLVATTIIASVHYYLYRRLVVSPELPTPWSTLLRALLALLAVSIPLHFIVILVNIPVPRYFFFPVYVWMGVMLLLFFALLGLDVLRGLAWLVTRVSGHEQLLSSPERRLFLSRAVAWAAAGTVLPAAGFGVVRGLGKVIVKPVEVRLRGLSHRLDGFTIVQLTDLHLGPMRGGDFLSEIVARTNELGADLVAITGDLVDGSVQRLAADVESLRSLKAKFGVFFVTGNHEYFNDLYGWMQHLPQLGIRVLRNERVTIERDGAVLELAGVDDPTGRRFAPGHGTDVARALNGSDSKLATVLLAHQPNVVDEAHRHGVALVLSGHTHGGQIWPFSYLVQMTQPYLKGLHNHQGTQIYVSEGTGFWGPPMRLGTRAEITLVTLRSA